MAHSGFASIRNIRALCVMLLLACFPALSAAQPKLTFGVPGVPAIFGTTIAFVADKEGFFKKHGVDVTVRQFETGAASSRAVAAGEISAGLPPTPLVVSQVSNTDVPLVGIWGMEHPDWLIGTTDPNATCDSLKGAPIGVDSIGGARSIALKIMLIAGCKMKIEDVQQVALGSNTGAAMIAGQLKFGVLHIDDVPVIEAETKKPVKTLVLQKASQPVDHYLLLVVRKDKLAENRDAFVRLVAGLIDAQRFMRDPANAAKVAQDAAPTGRSADYAVKSLKTYIDMEFWPNEKDGLDRTKIEAVGKGQKAVGNIKDDKAIASYERLVDPTVWRDANALVNKR
jgi:ABC-type nitrate/sulfonate/bicarbonate transport system substrate-binding protein